MIMHMRVDNIVVFVSMIHFHIFLLCFDSVMYFGCYSSLQLVYISRSGSTTGFWQKTAWR